jgi:hypothetical protein
MTFTVSSPRHIIPPIRSRHPPDDGSARPETTKPTDAKHRNTVPSTQNAHRARCPNNKNQHPIDPPTLKPTFDIENPSGAAPKSP